MTIGLFGGSFDPPHVAHLVAAETVREDFGLDAVWWMPAYRSPHKTGHTPAPHRLAMVACATADNPAFVVSDLELRRAGISFTVDTIQELQEAHPADSFALLLGGDSLHGFASWHRPDEIARRVPLIVYPRPGFEGTEVPPHFAARVHWADAPLLAVSATDIRARCQAGRSIRYLVPEPVRAYIEDHRLYRTD